MCAAMAVQVEERVYDRLFHILSSVSTHAKWNNFSLELDRTQRRTTRFLSDFYTGRLLNKDTGEVTHIVIKVVPLYGLISSYEQVYKNEICFYTKIFPALNKFQKSKGVKDLFDNVPNYLGGHLHDRKEFIIMEDIAAAGYKAVEGNPKYIDSKYLKSVFKVYARLHALSFVYKHEHPEEFKTLTADLLDILKILNAQELGKPIESAYSAAIDAFNPELEAEIVERLKKIENGQQAVGTARSYLGNYKCLTHGNCFVGNMLFKYKHCEDQEELNVKLIDFQMAYVSTPVHDLSYFFYSGATKADMDNLDYYLDLYYETFSSFVRELGADPRQIYPYEVFKEEWKQYSLLGVIMGISVRVKSILKKSDVDELLSIKSLVPREKRSEVWRKKLQQLHKENDFKLLAREVCLHAIEYGLL